MGTPYVGEIRMFASNFAPAGWELCQGQLLAISENDALFSLIGTIYGGDGQSTFALPDLRGRIPVHLGQGPGLSNRAIGQMGGTESVTLTTTQIPAHSHPLAFTSNGVSNTGNSLSPAGNHWARLGGEQPYGDTANVTMAADSLTAPVLGSGGGSQPHDNMAPYLAVNFIISMYGIYPTQS